MKRQISFVTTSMFGEEGEVYYRYVYHLWLRYEAEPILYTDNTMPTLSRRISHIIGQTPSKLPSSTVPLKNRRVYGRPSQYYDQVADMVIREFPALAPYVILKRANHVVNYEVIDKAEMPAPNDLLRHLQLIYDRKHFKWEAWYNRKYGGRS